MATKNPPNDVSGTAVRAAQVAAPVVGMLCSMRRALRDMFQRGADDDYENSTDVEKPVEPDRRRETVSSP